ncbi:hypothetical protein WMY93_026502 [Mugilogobius chulae]|uniref:Metalloendopeptidase n=1 Tax=Mugilogobius chulae TaxID=88201 RepID=A0AAW0N2H7_9GOBI
MLLPRTHLILKMNFYLCLLVSNLALSSSVSLQQKTKDTTQQIIDIGEEKDITEINKDLEDDIIEPMGIQRSSVNNPSVLWSLPVPYILHKSLEMNAKGVVIRALDQFRLKSCIDFKPRTNDNYYISVKKRGGCYSYIGQVFENGQDLSIGSYCDTKAIAEHEFLHALGFYHEQSRYDRDEYVTINFENIEKGYKNNFVKTSEEYSTTNGVPYDFMSVMHYGPYAFSNGNGTTITTKDPAFQDIIGQRLEMSPSDVKELNLLYKCNSSIAFQMHCSFSSGSMCQMSRCSRSKKGWESVTKAPGGPATDHTNLMSYSKMQEMVPSSFMHASTASGLEGESAWLETTRMTHRGSCHEMCLQFYYFHSGHVTDQLNIWVREFIDDNDFTGHSRLVGQITGNTTSHWQYHHVSISATKSFQVEFEARKGAGISMGGFSIDDINLSELKCPHVAIQVNEFEKVLESSDYRTTIYSKTQYTEDGYAYRVATILYKSYFGLLFQLVEGKNDSKLQWPVLNRQVTFQMVDQHPNIQLQMSKERSMTGDINQNITENVNIWDNPRKVGQKAVDENGDEIFVGPLIGRTYFETLEGTKRRDFLKGGSVVFVFSFQDITPLIDGSSLPCPLPPKVTLNPEQRLPCSTRLTTILPPTSATAETTTSPEMTTDDDNIFGFAPGFTPSTFLTPIAFEAHTRTHSDHGTRGRKRGKRRAPSLGYPMYMGHNLNAKGVILKAFDQFRLKSCIDFKPREQEEYYISVQKLDGCWSYYGRSKKNGQELSIGQYCDTIATVEHEFFHALGFYHEQSRYDRDDFVTIHLENVIKGKENNFLKVSSDVSTTHGTPYDYWSVMHYSKDGFSNGNGSTITTIDPAYQDIIGQTYEASATDIKELNLLYNCNSAIAFLMHCSFSDGTMCEMTKCSNVSNGWNIVSQAAAGQPSFDHTSLNSTMHSVGPSYFMHMSTATGQEGDSARLETKTMVPNRECHVQCLQFYYFHSGNESDQLNIWLREFQDEHDLTGHRHLAAQITGGLTSHWQLHHVPLNATKSFQVEFEVRKGAGSSTGGISIDDVNLSELECPHVTLQINDFDQHLGTTKYYYTPPQHSKEGYVYRFGAVVFSDGSEAPFVQMLSGNFDDQLEWPVPRRQVVLQFVDQHPNIQLQMSKQVIFTSGSSSWDNPGKTENFFLDENNQPVYYGPLLGYVYSRQQVNYRDIFKGNSAVFTFSFQDLTPVANGSTLPCPEPKLVAITSPPTEQDQGPCSPRVSTGTGTTTPSTSTSTSTSTSSSTPTTYISTFFILALALFISQSANRCTTVLPPASSPLDSALVDKEKLWKSPVPYTFGRSLALNTKGIVLRALDQFRLKSCIDFRPWDNMEEYFINVVSGEGCASLVGKEVKNGQDCIYQMDANKWLLLSMSFSTLSASSMNIKDSTEMTLSLLITQMCWKEWKGILIKFRKTSTQLIILIMTTGL